MKNLTVLLIALLAVVCTLSDANAQIRHWYKTVEIESNSWEEESDAFTIQAAVNWAQATLTMDAPAGSGYLWGGTKNVNWPSHFLTLNIYNVGSVSTNGVIFTPAWLDGWTVKIRNMDTGDCAGEYELHYAYVPDIQ